MSTASDSGVVELAGFRLDVSRRQLTGPDGAPVVLKPRVFDTLAYLAARPGEVIDKRDILAAVWPGVVVEENSLNQAVSLLRKALGDSREQPRIVATIPGRGYQLVVPVHAVEAATAAAAAGAIRPGVAAAAGAGAADALGVMRAERVAPFRTVPAMMLIGMVFLGAVAAAVLLSRPDSSSESRESSLTAGDPSVAVPRASLAVLPFTDMSEDGSQGYFADGLTDELMSQLAAVEGLRIAGRTSSFAWRERREDLRTAGRVLGVAYVVEGSVRRQADRLRITAQLAETGDGYQVWSQTYERDAGDVFAIQQDIARAVAAALPAELGVRPGDTTHARHDTDPDTYDLHLRANARLNAGGAGDLERAEELFRAAIARDANFIPSQIGLAQTLGAIPAFQPQRATTATAEADALIARMIKKAPDVADVHAMHAARLLFLQRDLLGARRALDEGIRAAPRARSEVLAANWMWVLRSMTGSVSSAVEDARAQARFDPLSLPASMSLQQLLHAAGRTGEAEAEYERSRDLHGDRSRVESAALIRAVVEGLDEATIRERRARLHAALPAGLQSAMFDPSAHLADRRQAVAQLRRELARSPDPGALAPQSIALWAAYFGDVSLALDALGMSLKLAGPAMNMPWDPTLRYVRADAGFKALMRQHGFEAYWRATGEWGDFCRPSGKQDFTCM